MNFPSEFEPYHDQVSMIEAQREGRTPRTHDPIYIFPAVEFVDAEKVSPTDVRRVTPAIGWHQHLDPERAAWVEARIMGWTMKGIGTGIAGAGVYNVLTEEKTAGLLGIGLGLGMIALSKTAGRIL
jgi:hypothetical protein